MLASGETVSPEQVLGPARPSRSLALTGDTGPAASVVDAATGVDLLVHEATFCADERAARPRDEALDGGRGGARRQGGGRRTARADAPLGPLLRRTRSARRRAAVFPATVVPRDFDVIEIPFAERGEPVLVPRGARRAAAPATPQPRRERGRHTRLRRPRPHLRHAAADRRGVVGGVRRDGRARRPPRPARARRRLRDRAARSPRSSARLTRRRGASTAAPRWSPSHARRSLPASACGRARPSGCRSATGGSTGSRCRSCSTSSTGRRRSPRRAASSRTTAASRSAPSIPTTSRPTGCSRSSPRSRPIDARGSRRPTRWSGSSPRPASHTSRCARLTARERAQPRGGARAHPRAAHLDLRPARPEEIAEGTARAERELPDRVVSRLDRLVVVAASGRADAWPGLPSWTRRLDSPTTTL